MNCKFFHSIDENGNISWQGVVLSKNSKKVRVLLFSWLTGEPTIEKVVSVESAKEWVFYKTHSEWIDAASSQ